jgi:hypothetical protein
VLRAFLRALFAELRWRARRDAGFEPGFIDLAPPSDDDAAHVLVGTARRLHHLIEGRAAGFA